MLSIVPSCGYRFRCRLGRFQREHLPGKRLAVLLLVAGVACSVGLNGRLPVSGHVLLWTLLLPFVAWLLRRDGRPFFGPVFFYDLVRSSHRGEQAGHRCLYAILLVCVLAGVYWSWFPNQGIEQLMRSRSMTVSQRARLAGSFFTSFMTVQFAIVFLITPLYTASAIAEQKERRTLDFLLLTDLSNREIILGMLGARLAKLLLLIMTGLPVLSLLEFLGGIDPGLVLAGFVATCMLMASLGSVSILASVHARTALGAVIVSYLVTLLLFVIAFLPCLPAAQAFFVVANPRLAGRPAPSPADLSTSLIAFSFIHGLIAILCCRSAIAHVRRAALAQKRDMGGTSGATTRPAVPRQRDPYDGNPSEVTYGGWGPQYPLARDSDPDSRPWRDPYSLPRRARPRVGADALLWKEIHAESAFGLGALRQLPFGPALAVLALLVFVIACVNAPATRGSVGEYVQDWVQRLEIVLNSVLLLIVALSASGRVSRERERRTLDNLLTLPVSRNAILFAKWLGSILSVGWLWCLLGPIWAVGVVSGAVNVFALPLLAAATMVYAGFVSSLGLWFSTISGSTMRAGLFTLLAALLFLAVPGALTTVGGSAFSLAAQEPFGWAAVMDYGFSPPTTLWVLSFRTADLLGGEHLSTTTRILAAVAGLHGYLAATAVFWILTRARFVKLGGSDIDAQRRPAGG